MSMYQLLLWLSDTAQDSGVLASMVSSNVLIVAICLPNFGIGSQEAVSSAECSLPCFIMCGMYGIDFLR